MKHTIEVPSLIHSITSLFVTRKPNITRLNHKDLYFKSYYFPKNLCDGVNLVAAIERTSKKRAAEILMTRGFSAYMGDKVTEQIKLDTAARERNEKLKRTRFAFILRKVARARGMDISNFI